MGHMIFTRRSGARLLRLLLAFVLTGLLSPPLVRAASPGIKALGVGGMFFAVTCMAKPPSCESSR